MRISRGGVEAFYTELGGLYSEDDHRFWPQDAKHERRRTAADIYVYFNNDPEGHAIRDAERLRLLLR